MTETQNQTRTVRATIPTPNRYISDIQVARPAHLGDGEWNIRGLTALTVQFGRNGSGKSQLLRLLCRTDVTAIHYVSPERGGSLAFDYSIAAREAKPQERQNSRLRNYADQFRMEAIGRIQALFVRRGYHGADSQTIRSQIEADINQLMPGFTFQPKPDSPFYELLRQQNNAAVSDLDQISSGEAQLFGLAPAEKAARGKRGAGDWAL